MSLFNKLTSDGLEESQDRLGGFGVFDSDIYTGKIKVAYAGTSSGGATSVSLVVETGGKEYRETFYVTNKKGENFFTKDGKKIPLPGFTIVDDICLIASGKPLANQETEEKVIKLYDFEQKAEVPKSVPVLTDLIGQEISLGVLKQLENKTKKNDSTGEYEATDETRETNTVDKVFHPEMKLTVAEARNGKEEPEFWGKWVEKNKGTVRDRTEKKGAGGGNAGAPPKPAAAGGTAAPRQSLFGKK